MYCKSKNFNGSKDIGSVVSTAVSFQGAFSGVYTTGIDAVMPWVLGEFLVHLLITGDCVG